VQVSANGKPRSFVNVESKAKFLTAPHPQLEDFKLTHCEVAGAEVLLAWGRISGLHAGLSLAPSVKLWRILDWRNSSRYRMIGEQDAGMHGEAFSAVLHRYPDKYCGETLDDDPLLEEDLSELQSGGDERKAKTPSIFATVNVGNHALLRETIPLDWLVGHNPKTHPTFAPGGYFSSGKYRRYLCSEEASGATNAADRWIQELREYYELPYLRFSGTELQWRQGNAVVAAWPAQSGHDDYQSSAHVAVEDKGPIPPGKWHVRRDQYQEMGDRPWYIALAAELGRTAWPGGESSWGRRRVWLEPVVGTDNLGRTGLTIHGGDELGSKGCIDLAERMADFAAMYLSHAHDMVLVVDYADGF
jgi:hypothetical protein